MAEKESGLRGVVAGRSELSSVDGEVGRLTYRGMDIGDLAAETSFEEVAYLLWEDKLPTRVQFNDLEQQINESRAIPGPVLDALASLPKGTIPMDALRTAVSMLGSFDPDQGDDSLEASRRKAVRLLAQTPNVVAQVGRMLDGRDPVDAPDGSIASTFLQTFFGEAASAEARSGGMLRQYRHLMCCWFFRLTMSSTPALLRRARLHQRLPICTQRLRVQSDRFVARCTAEQIRRLWRCC